MTLIKCPECGKEVSDRSNICINCGYPFHTNILPPSISETQLKNYIQQGETQTIKYIRSATGCGVEKARSILKQYMSINGLKFVYAPRSSITSFGLSCPKCGSSSITTGARGANGITGFIGASKTVNRCGKCGYMWKPRS